MSPFKIEPLELWLLNIKGGSEATLLEDLDQAKRIVQLITKVDTLIKSYSPEVKHVVRQNRDDLIFTLLPRRVWLSVKQLRSFEQGDIHEKNLDFQTRKDKEDVIVDGKLGAHNHRYSVTKVDSEPRLQPRLSSSDHLHDFLYRSLSQAPARLWRREANQSQRRRRKAHAPGNRTRLQQTRSVQYHIPNLKASKANPISQEVSATAVRLTVLISPSASANDRDFQESQPSRQLQNGQLLSRCQDEKL